MKKIPAVYIITNKMNTAIYIGVTSDLTTRIYQHKNKLIDGHSKKYNLTKLVYYEIYEDIENAINREKQLKKWSRTKKTSLINKNNNEWKDLYISLTE